MNRREFIAVAGTGPLIWRSRFKPTKSHVLTLSFDDGFKKSFYRISEIHETYGLKACLNVIATGHLKSFNTEPHWIPQSLLGNFDDWNRLKARGHEVMPHTWDHLNLTQIPVTDAKRNIDKCLNYFEKNLDGYKSDQAIYNFAYNASSSELDAHALGRVAAVRTGGWLVLNDKIMNPIPLTSKNPALGCWSHGPEECDAFINSEIDRFLKSDGGWLILNLHGLDQEGWGPITTRGLDALLKGLVQVQHLDVLPAGEVIKRLREV